MNKKSRNLIIGIILILLIVVVFLVYVTLKTKNMIEQNEIQANTKAIEENKNNVINNTIENKTENNIENMANNLEANENKEENTKNEEKNEEQNEVQINPLLSKEEIAIELVKNDWGTTEGVYFTKMAIDANGYYVIFVNKSGSENSSGSLKLAEYRVDSENYKIIRKKVSHNNY